MKIKHNSTTKKLFKDLHFGETFISNDDCYYMKIEPYYNANVVNIVNGTLGFEPDNKEVDYIDCEVIIK